jgi:hypothetical protein
VHKEVVYLLYYSLSIEENKLEVDIVTSRFEIKGLSVKSKINRKKKERKLLEEKRVDKDLSFLFSSSTTSTFMVARIDNTSNSFLVFLYIRVLKSLIDMKENINSSISSMSSSHDQFSE